MVIQALVQRGVYACDIARQLGVHPKTVSPALARAGPDADASESEEPARPASVARRSASRLANAPAPLSTNSAVRNFLRPGRRCASTAAASAGSCYVGRRPGIEGRRAPSPVPRPSSGAKDLPRSVGLPGSNAYQKWPKIERVGDFLFKHIEGHRLRTAIVWSASASSESINTAIKAVLRRPREA
jgi:hypothetical protein